MLMKRVFLQGRQPAGLACRGASLCLTLLALFVLGGCSIGPDFVRPQQDLPAAWRPGLADQGQLSRTWWRLFQDETLNALVDKSLARNHDLAIAAARVEEARAYLGVARAAQLPALGLDGGLSRHDPAGPDRLRTSYQGFAGLSFDIDFWGKYRRASEAARAELMATQAAFLTVRLAVICETARAYFALLSIDRQLVTAQSTLAARRKAEGLYRSRYGEGLSGEFELRQSEVETSTALAQVQSLEIAQVQAENALAVLTGSTPRELVEKSLERPLSLEKLALPDLVPAGLPSSLIERRPDLSEAEELLHAATADIGVAKAAFLPSFSLTGLFGWASTDFERIVRAGTREWTLAAGVAQPLFQGGRLVAGLKAANARQKAAYSAYEKAVQNAFREVLDALIANKKTRELVATMHTRLDKLKRAQELANIRYASGQTNFLEVLDAQRALFSAQISLAEAHQAQLAAVVNLCQALGGGWD